jgi:hypothetical protein
VSGVVYEGLQVYQSSTNTSRYVTLDGGLVAASPAPSTLAGQSAGSIVAANNAAHTLANDSAALDFSSQGVTVQKNVTMSASGPGGGIVTAVADQVISAPTRTSVLVPRGYAAYDLNMNPLLDAAGQPVTTLSLSPAGKAIIEMKTGGGQFTTGQAVVYPAATVGSATAVGGAGSNAARVDLTGKFAATPVYVLRPK